MCDVFCFCEGMRNLSSFKNWEAIVGQNVIWKIPLDRDFCHVSKFSLEKVF